MFDYEYGDGGINLGNSSESLKGQHKFIFRHIVNIVTSSLDL